jgi:hypothetical protein
VNGGIRRRIGHAAATTEENMPSRKPLVIAAAFGSVAGLALAIQVRAGGDKVAFPENYAAGLWRARLCPDCVKLSNGFNKSA